MNVVLVKLGRGSRAVVGRLVRTPRKGSVIVIEFSDGMHEYVTTPVKRVLKLAGKDVYYVETANSRYRLEVRSKVEALDGASSGLPISRSAQHPGRRAHQPLALRAAGERRTVAGARRFGYVVGPWASSIDATRKK